MSTVTHLTIAGISDYWVVDFTKRCIVVHRDPADGRYGSVQTYRESDEVRPLQVPDIKLCPARLWQPSS